MPVHFAERTRLDVEVRGGYGLGNGEVCRVGDAHFAASQVERLLGKHLVGELQLGLFVALGVLGNLLIDRVWR